eukprot:Sdes_comp8817_c0_seq1m204
MEPKHNVSVRKDASGSLGMSLGGGAPLCPIIYAVGITPNLPIACQTDIQIGDEIIDVNGVSLDGLSRHQVKQIIQQFSGEFDIGYRKFRLQENQEGGEPLDIRFTKLKHRISSNFGAEESLPDFSEVKESQEFLDLIYQSQYSSQLFKQLAEALAAYEASLKKLAEAEKEVGSILGNMGSALPGSLGKSSKSVGFSYHLLSRISETCVPAVENLIGDLNCFSSSVFEDIRLTLEKYRVTKAEYLAYYWKGKRLEEEEEEYELKGMPLKRCKEGNVIYRMNLRGLNRAQLSFDECQNILLTKLKTVEEKRLSELQSKLILFLSYLGVYSQGALAAFERAKLEIQ